MADKVLNINLEHGRLKRYTIDGDENRVLELNPSDVGLFSRIDEFDKAVTEAFEKFTEQQADSDDENFDIVKLGDGLKEIDTIIREQMDFLFDTNFSAVTVPHGTMLDPVKGEFRFQYLLDVFSELYSKQISKEMKERNDKIREHTKKYVKEVNQE